MTIELNSTEIASVGGGAKLSSFIVCNLPAPIAKLVTVTFEPSPTYDPVPLSTSND